MSTSAQLPFSASIPEDEVLLWAALLDGEWPACAGPRLGIHHKRVEYLCHKWARQGRYNYGTVYDMGWVQW